MARAFERLLLAAVIAALILGIGGAARTDAASIVNEPATGSTVANSSFWTSYFTYLSAQGNPQPFPCLTAGTNTSQVPVKGCKTPAIDSVGAGAVQLTNLTGVFGSGGIMSKALNPADGLQVTFNTAQFPSNSSGLSFVLANGATSTFGGADQGMIDGYKGLQTALAGVILDSSGNASSSSLDGTGCSGDGNLSGPQLVLRGPGNSTVGYCYIAGVTTPAWAAATKAAATHSIEVDVSPTGDSNPRFKVFVDGTQDIDVPLSSLSPSSYAGAKLSTVSTYKFGIAAQYAAADPYNEVWNIQASSLSNALTATAAGGDLYVGAAANHVVSITNGSATLSQTAPVTVTSALPPGVVIASLPSGSGWDCSATSVGAATMSCTYTLSAGSPLAPGASLPALTVPLTLTASAVGGRVNLDFEVSIADEPGKPVSATENVPAYGTAQPISVAASVDHAQYSAAGQTRNFTFTVTNNGGATVTGLAMTSSLAGASTPSCQSSVLAAGASTTCTSAYTTTQADIDAGSITALSTVSARTPTGLTVVSPQSAVMAYSTAGLHLTVTGSSSGNGYSHAGQVISYTFAVVNTGIAALQSIHLTTFGAVASAVQCPSDTLAGGALMNCTATHVISQDDVDGRTLTTTVQGRAQSAQGVPVTSDPSAITVTGRPVPVVKLAVKTSSTRLSSVGAKLLFTFTVTNAGDMTMHKPGVSIAIKHFGALSCPAVTLAPGASATCRLTHVVTKADYAGKKLSVAIHGTLRDPTDLVIASPITRIKLAR